MTILMTRLRTIHWTRALAPLLLLAAGACSAADAPASDELPAPVKAVEAYGVEVMGRFDAPAGLTGYAGALGQQPVAIYLTADGEHALVGRLLDASGQDVGEAELQRLVAAPIAERTWKQLEASTWVADGSADAERIVYTFSDPNCPYCNRFWQNARPWVDAGKVQLRHVMVGIIAEDSDEKAAAILGAELPGEALARNERNFASGGIAAASSVSADLRGKLDANQRLMLELGFQGTPAILFRDADGLLQRRSGLPPESDMETVLGPAG